MTDVGAVVRVEGLTRRFGELTAVEDLNFAVQHGELFGLLGPDGAGKTTTTALVGRMLQAAGLPTEVGGTHPVIVEGMAAGTCLLVSDHAPNVEVVGDGAATFALTAGTSSLTKTLGELVSDQQKRDAFGARAELRATERYSWTRCAERYIELCQHVSRQKARQP